MLPALVGPTGIGKTALSLEVACRLDAEVISMDSRQVYRGMDIGTAKLRPEERGLVPHHGLDLVDPGEAYSAARFARDARLWIREIAARSRLPLLVGGTGFFLRALTDPVFREPPVDPGRRGRLREWLAGRKPVELRRWLAVLDPARLAGADPGGRHRLSRGIEVALLTGRPLSWWHREGPLDAEPIDVRSVLLELERAELYRRIDRRTEAMFEGGLLDEVRCLLEGGVRPDDPGMTATGYREAAAVVQGELPPAEAVRRVQSATRRYARRQLTWFRNQRPAPSLRIDVSLPLAAQAERVEAWWRRTGAGAGGVAGA